MLPNALQPNATDHVPVLADEVRRLLDVQPGDTVVDATFGAGGHAALLAADLAASRPVHRDRPRPVGALVLRALPRGARVQARFLRGEFATVLGQLAANGVQADAILLDLGVSSMQLDRPERGFSYAVDAPLDMRMDPSADVTAADLVNEASERELADDLPPLRRGALRATDRPRDRPPPAPRAVRAHGRARRDDQGRDPHARPLRRRPSRATRLPGAPHRRQRRARAARGSAARRRVEMLRPAGPARRDQLPLARGPDRQALLPRSRRAAASARPTSRSARAAATRSCACSRRGRSGRPRARSRSTRAPRRRGSASRRRSDGLAAAAAERVRSRAARRRAEAATQRTRPARPARGMRERRRLDRRSSPSLLAGVVALNVAVLRLNLRLDDLGQQRTKLARRERRLASKLASSAATARIEQIAARSSSASRRRRPNRRTFVDVAP